MFRWLSLSLVSILVGLSACYQPTVLPNEDDIPEDEVLSIDGDWNGFTLPYKGIKLRLDHGRLYLSEPFSFTIRSTDIHLSEGAVIAHNFRQSGPKEFECDFALLETFVKNGAMQYVPVTAKITNSRSLTFYIPNDSGSEGPYSGRGEQVFLRSDDPGFQYVASIDPGDSEIQAVVNPQEVREEVASEIIEIPTGAVFRIKRARSIDHTVDLQLDTAIHGELSLDVLSWLRASVQGQVERTVGHGFKESETIEHEITLDGNKGRRYKLTWHGNFLVGTAKLKQNSIEESIPFRIKISEDFSAVPIP